MPNPATSIYRAIGLVVIAAVAHAPTVGAQTRSFIVRLGTDTFAIERFTRTSDTVVGEVLRHVPSTTVLRYRLTLAPDGTPATYEEGIFAADGSPLPPTPQGISQTGFKMTFIGDSVVREIVQRGQIVSKRTAAPHGTLPALGGTSPYYQELALDVTRRLHATEFPFITFAMNVDTPNTAEVRFVGRDSAEIWLSGFPRVYKLDAQGHVLRGDGARSTLRQIITPIPPVDLAPIASAWAARDAKGLAIGTPSTRDTMIANVGDATLWLDYGRPAKRGRIVWGQLVPLDTVWRFGANAAAQLRTDKDILIGDASIPAGLYSVWLLPSAKGTSLLIVNRQHGQWGTVYDASQDLARIPITRHPVATNREERYRVSFTNGRLRMLWDDAGYDVPVRPGLRSAGDTAIVRHDWKALVSIYEPVTRAQRDNGMAWFRLGAGLHELGRYKEAASAMREAVRLQFQLPQAEWRLARSLARSGATDSVSPHLERAATAGLPVELITTEADFSSVRTNAAVVALVQRLERTRYPCRSLAETHQFDFWIGDWIVTGWNAPTTVALGRPSENHITAELEHCLIKERWEAATGGRGESINFWDPNRRAWRQIWMDQNQWSLDYEGEYTDGAMRFHGWTLGPNGERRLEKLTFFNVAPDTVRQLFEQSTDSGTTWRTTFDGRYVRKKKSEKKNEKKS